MNDRRRPFLPILVFVSGTVFGIATTMPIHAIEEPRYTVTLSQNGFEVREYPALLAAEVTVSGDRDQAASAGFRLLAGYIFGGNTRRQSLPMTAPVVQQKTVQSSDGESIAMTAPVLQTETAEEGSWVVRFILPRAYTLATLPQPNDSRVRLVELPPTRFAVVRFSGLARPQEVERRTAAVRAFALAQSLTANGPASLARYNPPWTLWFLRRNEILLPLTAKTTR